MTDLSFLDFKFLDLGGTKCVELKPICEALLLNYEEEVKKATKDVTFQKHLITDDNKSVYLFDHLIYGWMFGLESENEAFKAWQEEALNVLIKHSRKDDSNPTV